MPKHPPPSPTVSAASIARAVHARIPTATIQHTRPYRLWLLEHDEPFAEIDYTNDTITLRVSTHCSPAWAAITAASLGTVTSALTVLDDTFIQKHDGCCAYGAAADTYWTWYRDARPLLTARFRPQDKS